MSPHADARPVMPQTMMPQSALPHPTRPQPSMPHSKMPQTTMPQLIMPQSNAPQPTMPRSNIQQPYVSHWNIPQPMIMPSTMLYAQVHARMRTHFEPRPIYYDQENVAPVPVQYCDPHMVGTGTNRKRKSSPSTQAPSSKRQSTGIANTPRAAEQQLSVEGHQKPLLSTLDLEFDYDRSQLRDPRATPSRASRPRYDIVDCPEELRSKIEATREIPKPMVPPGRLNRFQKDQLSKEESRMNPLKSCHDLHQCHSKGLNGPPTYDDAGFQLDYHKVADWTKPKSYNKKRMSRNIHRSMDKTRKDREEMFGMFFQSVPTDARMEIDVENYVKDRVSKDLNIPWHQIKPDQVKMWRAKGFQPLVFEEWWKEPNAEERKRMMKIITGASLRKHL